MTSVVPSWHFDRKPKFLKDREPVQEEFFNNAASIRNRLAALIREAVQNILDQAVVSGGPVSARIYLSQDEGALPAEVAKTYFRDLWQHIGAMGREADGVNEPCRFMVVEDFGTTGLVGDAWTDIRPSDDEPRDFYYFYRVEGRSSKSGAKGGRRGVGKIVFSMASDVASFIGLTRRDGDHQDEGSGLLMGQTTGRNHTLSGTAYLPDGWLADLDERDGERVPVPIKDPLIIEEFQRDWCVTRSEPGLSIVIPYLTENWGPRAVADALIADYFLAIHSGRLSVTVDSFGAEPCKLTTETLAEEVEQMLDDEAKTMVRRDLDALTWAETVPAVQLDIEYQSSPSWGSAKVDPTQLEELSVSFRDTRRAHISIPVRVARKDETLDEISSFRVILVGEEGPGLPATFVRTGIVVSEANPARIHGVRALVVIDDDALASMLGDAEGPAHTNWNAETETFRGKYWEGKQWISIVRNAPQQLIRLLSGAEDEADISIAADIFAIPGETWEGESGTGDGGGQSESEGDDDQPDKTIEVPPSRPKALITSKTSDGFEVKGTTRTDRPSVSSAIVRIAYAVLRGDPFKKWAPNDFVLSNRDGFESLEVSISGCNSAIHDNEIVLTDIDLDQVCVRVVGFDTNRDVVLSIRETL